MLFKTSEQVTVDKRTTLRENYERSLRELHNTYDAEPSGRDVAARRSDMIDELIQNIAAGVLGDVLGGTLASLKGVAVLALGGYGRRELCPASDIDLMILHRLKNRVHITQISEELFYPLWDLGLEVGHGTRTLKESLRMAASDFEVQTSLLEARLITGDNALLEELQLGLTRQIRARGGVRFLENILAENERRHLQYGQAAYLLEPDIKDGEGGLRDIQAIIWSAKGLFGITSLNGLDKEGYLSAFDARALERAYEFMLMVRTYLHHTAERKTDRLFFEYQAEIAKGLGFKKSTGSSGVENFMRRFYTHASAVERISRGFWDQLKDTLLNPVYATLASDSINIAGGIVLRGGRLSLASADAVRDYPGSEIKLFRLALEHDYPLDFKKLDLVREGLEDLPRPDTWTRQVRDDFIEILKAGSRALPALGTMDHLGLLSRYIPEWEHVVCLPQHDAYHLYTVDMHSFLTVAELQKIGAGNYDSTNPLLRELYGEIERTDLLVVAALLHDVGKGAGHEHSKRGSKMVKDVCARMGFTTAECRILSTLVGQHLLLPDTAMRRDLNDENVIIELASTIADGQIAKMLYLLSIADALATGPKAWDAWKDILMRELFSKVHHIIESGEYTSKKSIERRKKIASSVKSSLAERYENTEIEAFLAQMPPSYLQSQTSDDIIRHFKLMRDGRETIGISAQRKDSVCELTLVAADEPGLFCKVSGVLALNGVNILGAQVYTRSDGTALDIFRIASYFDKNVDEDVWDKIKTDIKRALAGKISLEYRVAEKAKRYKGNGVTKQALKKSPEVRIDNTSSDFYTVIEVHAEDRIGLLYSITRVMYDLRLDIHLAKVSTSVDKVVDVFYVWDINGQKLDDAEQIDDVKKAILMALE
jgi:[protein-PII] uridylyltransferase